MRTTSLLRPAAAVLAIVTAACGTSQPAAPPASAAPVAQQPAPAVPPRGVAADADTVSGVVAETMNSGGYTYARLTAGPTETWIAGTEFPVKVGDTLTGAVDMPMADFHSRTLNRDFKQIYFVREVALNGKPLAGGAAAPAGGGAAAMPALAGSHDSASPARAATGATGAPGAPAATATLIAKVAPAPGGVTVADLRAKQATLAGKPVVVRGQIVKANYEIMGTNWYHLQDGSGKVADGSHDLMVTSDAQAKTGDVVTVSGVLTTNKDFGAGYAYDVIIEKAAIKP